MPADFPLFRLAFALLAPAMTLAPLPAATTLGVRSLLSACGQLRLSGERCRFAVHFDHQHLAVAVEPPLRGHEGRSPATQADGQTLDRFGRRRPAPESADDVTHRLITDARRQARHHI